MLYDILLRLQVLLQLDIANLIFKMLNMLFNLETEVVLMSVSRELYKDYSNEELFAVIDRLELQVRELKGEMLHERNILCNKANDIADSLYVEIIQENIDEDEYDERLHQLVDDSVIYYYDCWSIVSNWNGSTSDLDSGLWEGVTDIDKIIQVMAYEILWMEVIDTISRMFKGDFNTDDFMSLLGTFEICKECDKHFSTDLDFEALDNEQTISGGYVCGDCRESEEYKQCIDCGVFYPKPPKDTGYCFDCSELINYVRYHR